MHFDHRIALLSLAGLVGGGIALGGGCSGDQEAVPGAGVCGNGIVEAGEQCDDGNLVDDDSCSNTCVVRGGCGDGVIDDGEECDDGNSVNDDGCTNQCLKTNKNCGNGVVDEADGEECDDGNDINEDGCTNYCTLPFCGDGIVQAGEDCDPGSNQEVDPSCPPNCMKGPPPCEEQAILAGMVTNDASPTQPGPGVSPVWSYGGQLGIAAGNEMCAAIGADHPCTYKEVVQAEANGEFEAKGIPVEQEFWLHRVTESVPKLSNPAEMTAPGAGGRCNDWTYPTNHISDGEFAVYDPQGSYPAGRKIGGVTYFFDDDTAYNMMSEQHSCELTGGASGMTSAKDPNGEPGCSGSCGGAEPKAILCCYAACE